MRTIRHKLLATVEARVGSSSMEVDFLADVTVPWADGPESRNHGSPDHAQVTFYIYGPDGDVEVTLSAEDTTALAGAILEAREHLEWMLLGDEVGTLIGDDRE